MKRTHFAMLAPITMIAFSAASCGKKSSSTPDAATPAATTPAATTKTIVTTDTLAIFTSVDTTAASTGSAQGLSGGLALDDNPTERDGYTTHCSKHGEPISSDASKNTSGPDSGSTIKYMARTDPAYVAGKAYCVITHNTADPESLRGALSQMQLFSCMIGKNATFDGQPHDLDVGSTAFAACFTGTTPAAEGVTKATLTASNPPAFGDSSWDFCTEFAVTISGSVIDMKLLWKSSEGKAGFASLMPPVGHPDTTGKSHDAFIVVVDNTNQRMTLDSSSQRLYSQGYSRRLRITANGTFDTDNKFTKVDKISFVEAELYAAGNGGDSAPADPLAIGGGYVWTASGDTTHGFLTENYSAGNGTSATSAQTEDVTKWTALTGVDGKVYDGDGSGTGVTAIKLEAKADLGVVLYPNYSSYVDPSTWFGTAPVPTWTAATLAAVHAN